MSNSVTFISKQISMIYKVFSVVLVFLLMSCNDQFLDLDPNTSIPEGEAYNSPTKIAAHVNNLYAKLQNPNLYGGRWIIFNEQRADEFGQNDGNAATGSAVWNQNVASTNEYINDVWSAAYSAVNSANLLMENLENSNVVSDSLRKIYIAEAKFVRALSFLILTQTYAKPYFVDKAAPGIPLRLTAIRSSGHNDLVRSPVEEVYNQIIKDLDEAELDLPVSFSSISLNKSRAHKATAVALKTRVYLNMNMPDKVIQEASKIVSSSPPYQFSAGATIHALEPSVAALFTGSYTGVESIFSIPFINSTTETPAAQYALAFNYVTQPILFLTPAGIVANEVFQSADDARNSLIGLSPAKHRILKKFSITTAPFRDYVPVLRYAEVILNYAEAAAKMGQLSLALDLLNSVRHRSSAQYVFSNDQVSTSDALVQTILMERRIEFLGEGLRLQDIQRNGLALPSKTGSIGLAPEVPPTAKNYMWPIPSGELTTNKLCVPN